MALYRNGKKVKKADFPPLTFTLFYANLTSMTTAAAPRRVTAAALLSPVNSLSLSII
jgi:hypothetical protein